MKNYFHLWFLSSNSINSSNCFFCFSSSLRLWITSLPTSVWILSEDLYLVLNSLFGGGDTNIDTNSFWLDFSISEPVFGTWKVKEGEKLQECSYVNISTLNMGWKHRLNSFSQFYIAIWFIWLYCYIWWSGGGRSHHPYCLSLPPCSQGNLQGMEVKIVRRFWKTACISSIQAPFQRSCKPRNRE